MMTCLSTPDAKDAVQTVPAVFLSFAWHLNLGDVKCLWQGSTPAIIR